MKNLKTLFVYKCNEPNNKFSIELSKEEHNGLIFFAIWVYRNKEWLLLRTNKDYKIILGYYMRLVERNLKHEYLQ